MATVMLRRNSPTTELTDVLLGNLGAQIRLKNYDGVEYNPNTAAVLSTGNYPLYIRSPIGNHIQVRKSDDSGDALLVTDAGITGSFTPSGQFLITAGTAAAPGLAIQGDPDTGIYHPTTDTGGLAAAGAVVATWQAGAFRVVDGSLSNPSIGFISDTSNNSGFYWIADNRFAAVAGAAAVAQFANVSGQPGFQVANNFGTDWVASFSQTNSSGTTHGVRILTAAGASADSALYVESQTVPVFDIRQSGQVLVGGTGISAFMTQGVIINQGAADNEVLNFKSSDVAHGMTTFIDTDTFGAFQKLSPTDGGVTLVGATETTRAFMISANGTSEDTTHSTAGVGHMVFVAWTKSGTSSTDPGAGKNILAIKSGSNTRFIFNSDGTSYEDVGTVWTNYHDYDDMMLISAVAANVTRADDPIRERFGQWLFEKRDELERLDLVSFNDGPGQDGHAFLNTSKFAMLLAGAIQQIATRFTTLESRIKSLEAPYA